MTTTQTAPTTAANPTALPSGKIAVVKASPDGASFTCVVDGITVGTSKHKDYFEFHKRRGDIVRLNDLDISKFVYVDSANQITDQVKVEGAAPARGAVVHAIKKAENPTPAPVGFNNQTHAQAQENGRKGAEARLRNVSSGGDRPNAVGANVNSKPTATSAGQTVRAASMKASTDKPAAKASGLTPDELKQRQIENGKKGAARAAELRAQAASSADKVVPLKRGPVVPARSPSPPKPASVIPSSRLLGSPLSLVSNCQAFFSLPVYKSWQAGYYTHIR